jgi:hypothetical protein
LLGERRGDLVLRLCNTAREGKQLRLSAAKATIGSAREATLRIVGNGVAPIHCVILRGKHQTVARQWAKDARLNDSPFTDAPLKPGDRIGLGPVELEVVADERGEPVSETVSPPLPPTNGTGSEPSDLADERRQLDEQASALAELRRQHEQDWQRWQAERAEWLAERNVWLVEHDARKAEQQRWQADREAAQAEREAFEVQRTVLNNERLTLENDRAAVNQERAALEEEMATLKRKKSALVVESETNSRQAEEAAQERKKLAAEKAALTKRRNSLEREQQALEQLERDLQSQEKALADERKALEEKAASVQLAANQSLDVDRNQLELLKQTLETELVALDAERKTLVQDQKALAMSRETLDADHGTLKTERQQLDVERQVLVGERQALEEHYSAQAETFRSTNDSRLELERQRAELADELQRLQADRQTLQVEWQTLDTQVAGLAAERQIIASQRQSLELQQQRLANEQQTVVAARQMLEGQRRNWDSHKVESSAEAAQITERMTDRAAVFAAAREDFERQRAQWEAERDQLQAQLSDELQHCQRQLLELNALREEFNRERAAWEERRLAGEAGLAIGSPAPQPEEANDASLSSVEDDEARRDEEVFARLRAYALLNPGANDGPTNHPDKRVAHDADELSPANSRRKPPVERDDGPTAASAAPRAADEEESVDDYMARLMNRIRGSSEPSEREFVKPIQPPRAPVEPPRPKRETQPTEQLSDRPSPSAAPNPVADGPVELVARSAPPELGVNLQAMRDLANMTARGAIQRHIHGRWGKTAVGKSIGGLVSFVCGVWLTLFQATSAPLFTRTIGVAGVVAGTFWISQAAWLARNLHRAGRRTANSREPSQPIAQSDEPPAANVQAISIDAATDELADSVKEPEGVLQS